ncbi:uncharacterized protein NESG_00109 [Nematocida ausubeli]|uniref:Uncharacterized protein n=1 Tax=Nematocida ausubeli (strain ATCC PRA-371 / ERTm2) TaxID=1913371 RepID=A0A086J4G9_NEMA1|nr:uncharacterized protein NESG_00109 [Nematocida ausubeli]KFG27037.1 hypothetical protein NESG_00109 [Nematocida ausubeli]
MHSAIEEKFELMDIMRYTVPTPSPAGTPECVMSALRQHTPLYLLDVYLYASGIPIRALLHPSMYSRVLKGWLKIGSIVKILGIEGDMITELERTEECSERDLTSIKKDVYITLPNPIYSPKGYYMPLLSDEGYMKWDRRWKRFLEKYLSEADDQEILLANSLEELGALSKQGAGGAATGKKSHLVIRSEEEDKKSLFEPKARVNQAGYKNAQNNTICGQVILKSRLFTFSSGGSLPLFFSFILLTSAGLVKVYVWKLAVRKFFCIKEGDSIFIRGFKIKRRPGALLIADRTNTDSDTKYASIPEISVNLTEPTGHIMEMEMLHGLPKVPYDPEFTTVIGTVEYVSSLFRYREGKARMKFREYVYLKVSGIIIKLLANDTESIIDIKTGTSIEVRHLRKGTIGPFEFYISSLYTQFYLDRSNAPLFDKHVITGDSTSVAEENAMGYIPVCFSTYCEHMTAANDGIGVLCIKNKPIPRESPDSAYIKKDRMYFGELRSLSEAMEEINSLCMDELKRFVVAGKLAAVKYQSQGDCTIGDSTVDISYMATETTIEEIQEEDIDRSSGIYENTFCTKIEENIVLRIQDKSCFIDIQVFQNHLVYDSFEESVLDFLKAEKTSASIYEELKKRVGNEYYVVFDAIRVDEEVVLHVGVSLLV